MIMCLDYNNLFSEFSPCFKPIFYSNITSKLKSLLKIKLMSKLQQHFLTKG